MPALATVSVQTVALSRVAAGALSNYTIDFTTTAALAADTDTITIVAAGTVFPLVASDYTIAGNQPIATPTGGTGTVTIKTHFLVNAGAVEVVASRVTNPAAVSQSLTVQTTQEITPVASASYTITAATAITGVSVGVSPAKVSSTVAAYTISATAATVPVSGYDSITLTAPTGTTFPVIPGDYKVQAGGALTLVTATPTHPAGANTVTIGVPTGSTSGSGSVALTVIASGVTNPPTQSNAYTLSVVTTVDSTLGNSTPYNVGPLTSVTAVAVSAIPAGALLTSNYTVGFAAATALLADTDTITIIGPSGTVFPTAASAYSVNGTTTIATPTVTPNNVTITTHGPVSVGPVTVAITGVTNPAGGSKTLTVATSEDSTATTSAAYVITVVSGVTVATSPTAAAAIAMYSVGFVSPSALAAGTDTITIVGPTGTLFPLVTADYTVNGTAITATPTGSTGTVVITTPVSVVAGSTVTVVALGVTNPNAASQSLTVQTSADGIGTSSPYGISAATGTQATAVTVSLNPTTTGLPSTYTIGFHTTTVVAGGGTITIVGPFGTVFPAAASAYTINGTVAASATGGGATAVLHSTNSITAGTTATVVASGVTNPAVGMVSLTVATSGDVNASASPFYAISGVVAGGGGGTPGTVPATPVRLSGADRFGTAIAASQVEFPTAGTAGAVVLARSDDYPDALVGAALAHARNAPLLFANGGALTLATQAEIQRVLPAGGTVYLLGGTAAIPASVATSLTSLGFVPTRYAGTDRFGTALAVADALGDPSTVLLATGINFPDALAAGPAAAHVNGVVLLTNGPSLTPAVTAYLAAHPGTVYAIGGPAVAADPSATALSGADRYATAAMVATSLFTAPVNVGLASGTAFPDALSGGAFQAHFNGPIVLSDPHVLPTSTSAYLTAADGTIVTTNIFGGPVAISAPVQAAVSTALGL